MRRTPFTLAALGVMLLTAACTDNDTTSAAGAVEVSSTDDACTLGADEAAAGNVVFEITNDGSEVTEFYLLAEDGLRVLGEVENIGPGITRNMVVQVGAYTEPAKLKEARQKVEQLGFKTYTQVVEVDGTKRTRVRVGPFATKAEADKAAARIKASGLPVAILTL